MKVLNSIKSRWNEFSHSKETGAKLTPLQDAIDELTQLNTVRALKPSELTRLRTLTLSMTGAKVGMGIATGLILGKSIFTGALLAIGAYVVTDIIIYSPMQGLTDKVLTNKTK